MNKFKSLLIPLSLIFVFGLSGVLISCGDDDEPEAVCNQCESDTPWSIPSSDTCYETLSECEAAEGESCQQCT